MARTELKNIYGKGKCGYIPVKPKKKKKKQQFKEYDPFNIIETFDKCKCGFCETYDRYRWAVISECHCYCHQVDAPIGHDSQCCQFTNGKRKNNPYTDLQPAQFYKEKLDKMQI